MAAGPAHSIKARFSASLVGNLLRSVIAFMSGLLLARWLGPHEYGRLAFLLGSFAAFRAFLDMGTATAFFTLLSQRARSRRFVLIFWRWVAIQFVASLFLLCWAIPDSVIEKLWLNEPRPLLVLTFVATFMQGSVWTLASQMAEANRQSIRVQRLNTLVVVVHLLVLVALWQLGRLAIPAVLVALVLEWGLAGYVAAKMYKSSHESLPADEGTDTVRSVWKEFAAYCMPLVFYSWLGVAHDFADRWMLQSWGGSIEQGYFGVAQQFATVALLATSSILGIFWKEIAEAHHHGDTARVAYLYRKVSRLLFFIGAVVAGGLLPWADEILSLTVGAAYVSGAATLRLMFLFPVHQSLGQIGGVMLYATGNTRTQATLGSISMVVSMLVAYFMIAPTNAPIPGLDLGSQGLAWKMVLLQLIQVNIVAWFISRIFGWRFDYLYQLGGMLSCALLGWISHALVAIVMAGKLTMLQQIVVAGGCYLCFIVILICAFPGLMGMTRDEVLAFFRRRYLPRQQ